MSLCTIIYSVERIYPILGDDDMIFSKRCVFTLLIILFGAIIAQSQEDCSVTPVKAEIKEFGGAPTLFVNDKPQPILIAREHQPDEGPKHDYIKKAVAGGVNIVWVDVKTFAPYLFSEDNLRKSYDSLDKEFSAVLKDIPNAYILLQITTDIKPRWHTKWCKQYPDELMIWPPAMEKGERVSVASKIWLETQKQGIKELVTHIRQSPYSGRVIGGVLCGGNGEWLDWWDYSEPARIAFADWLRSKYGNDVAALRKAWNDDKADFEKVSLPAWKSLFDGDIGLFWDSAKSQKKIDFLFYHHELTANVIIELAEAMKGASNKEMIVGAWNGAFFMPAGGKGERGIQRRRHGAYYKLARSPFIDFFHTPYAYREREAGGVYTPQVLVDSITMHGKMAVTEDDTRTLLTNPHARYPVPEKLGDNFGQAKDLNESISLLKRNFAGIFSKPGSGITWFSLGQGLWFDHPEIIKTFSVFRGIADRLLGKDRKNSRIAVIVSNKSLFYQKLNGSSSALICAQLVDGLCRMGAPFDVYEDFDITSEKFPHKDYKFYIFLNTFHLSEAERLAIDKNIKTNGNTVLWIYAPGFVGDNGISSKSVSELTGMEIENLDPVYTFGADVVLVDYSSPITKGLPTNIRYGTEFFTESSILSPVFLCKDKNAQTLGMMRAYVPDICSFNRSGLCMKKFDSWTSVWSGAPNLPSNLLRNMAKYAGVHIYDDGDDQLFASEMLLAVNARYAGNRKISLPEKYNVYDPFQKGYIARDADRFECYIDAGDTKIWLLEKDKK